jgi:hypothetical protein
LEAVARVVVPGGILKERVGTVGRVVIGSSVAMKRIDAGRGVVEAAGVV